MTASSHLSVHSPGGETAAAERRLIRSTLRTPRGNGALLQLPPLSQLGETARSNSGAFSLPGSEPVWGEVRPTPAERRAVRAEVLQSAEQWTGRLLGSTGQPVPPDRRSLSASAAAISPVDGVWFVTGHQPALFHPGVWIKNFAVSALARSLAGATGLNLIVDNDLSTTPAVAIPEGSSAEPRWGSVPYDDPQAAGPWEETRVVHRDRFTSFGDRVETSLSHWGWKPLVKEYWPRVLRAESELHNPGWAFAAARATTEWDWGFGNLELPLSALCQLAGFRRFAIRLLNQLPRFQSVYNSALTEYRQVYRLRSRTHPVPDLRHEDEWLEAPFWIWHAGDRQRMRLMVRLHGGQIELSDGRTILGAFSQGPAGLAAGVETLQTLESQGIKLRTRALTTTLFSRLYFADLFLHGVGGAKYDEITDQIIAQFCGLAPPAYATLSATVRLPLPSFSESPEDLRRLKQQLRSAEQHPRDFLDKAPDADAKLLLDQFERLIAEQQAFRRGQSPSRELASDAATRYRQLQQLRQQLLPLTHKTREGLVADLRSAEHHIGANAVLMNREFAFCLFPSEQLRSFVEDACRAIG